MKFLLSRSFNNFKGNGEEFINKMREMNKVHHINIVCLVGFSADGFCRALVYEFLPNGSLENFIFSTTIKKMLTWLGETLRYCSRHDQRY